MVKTEIIEIDNFISKEYLEKNKKLKNYIDLTVIFNFKYSNFVEKYSR